jgi:hypothetical protein
MIDKLTTEDKALKINLTKDIYVNETSQVVSDMIKQGVLVKGN